MRACVCVCVLACVRVRACVYVQTRLSLPGLEVKKLSTVSDSKQSAMIGCLQTRVCKQPNIGLYFESEDELKFYNLKA